MQAVAENAVETIVESTKSVFQTMVSMDLESGMSFYKEERMIRTDVMALVGFTGGCNGTMPPPDPLIILHNSRGSTP